MQRIHIFDKELQFLNLARVLRHLKIGRGEGEPEIPGWTRQLPLTRPPTNAMSAVALVTKAEGSRMSRSELAVLPHAFGSTGTARRRRGGTRGLETGGCGTNRVRPKPLSPGDGCPSMRKHPGCCNG